MKTKVFFAAVMTCGILIIPSCGTSRQSADVIVDDEVIDVGYGKTTKKTSTYAAAKVKINDNEITSYSNIYDYLRGRVPGVSVSSNNRIIIRGIGTNSGETDPLIIVDGIEVSDISGINPRDVADINVLKDGSSSIYGARGANGVIIINLKH